MAPQVKSLADIMADLAPAYQGQKDIYAQQGAQVQKQAQDTITGLKAQRGEAWNDIGRSANARGFAFGGIRADEQARYDSTHFMPAVANVENQAIKGALDLSLASAGLDTDARKTAMGWQQSQQQALNQWNMQQAQLEAQRRENELNRQFQASQSAAARATSGGGQMSSRQGFISALNSYVNPEGPYRGVVNDTILGRLVSQAGDFGLSTEEARAIAKTYSVRANSKY